MILWSGSSEDGSWTAPCFFAQQQRYCRRQLRLQRIVFSSSSSPRGDFFAFCRQQHSLGVNQRGVAASRAGQCQLVGLQNLYSEQAGCWKTWRDKSSERKDKGVDELRPNSKITREARAMWSMSKFQKRISRKDSKLWWSSSRTSALIFAIRDCRHRAGVLVRYKIPPARHCISLPSVRLVFSISAPTKVLSRVGGNGLTVLSFQISPNFGLVGLARIAF